MPTSEFSLSIECLLDQGCSGDILVEVSAKTPAEDCGRAPRPPPTPPTPPPSPPVSPPPPKSKAMQCSSFTPPTTRAAVPIVAIPESSYTYAQTKDCPTSCGAHCEAGCLFCSDSGVMPGGVPPSTLPNTEFIALSTSAKTGNCDAAVDASGKYLYATGSLVTVTGLQACLSSFYRASHVCSSAASCGTWVLDV